MLYKKEDGNENRILRRNSRVRVRNGVCQHMDNPYSAAVTLHLTEGTQKILLYVMGNPGSPFANPHPLCRDLGDAWRPAGREPGEGVLSGGVFSQPPWGDRQTFGRGWCRRGNAGPNRERGYLG